jgi:hypothetical protein
MIHRGVEIDDRGGALRVCHRERRDFIAAQRMSGQHGLRDARAVECGADMGHSRVEVVTVSLRLIGFSEPRACDREHAKPIREPRRKVVEHVGRVAESGEEHEARPVASPV